MSGFRRRSAGVVLSVLGALSGVGCFETRGNSWMAEPLNHDGELLWPAGSVWTSQQKHHEQSNNLPSKSPTSKKSPRKPIQPTNLTAGNVLGKFRNTYYDLPYEGDYHGPSVDLMNVACKPIKKVPRSFYATLCVQGSGTLVSGATASFAKRDCACAAVCPKTKQHICFDSLDRRKFPFGRGSMGQAITPLRTIAVDPKEIPLGTWVYIPEYEGVPIAGGGVHDGCFLAEDRGLHVKGKHVDVFTGREKVTKSWNKSVPSNEGVTVVTNHPKCSHMDLRTK
jgi:3D (Asp-Asp-Asp) domain-containing protein